LGATVGSDSKLYAHSCSRQHVHQRVDAEEVDLATNEVADPRLRHAKEARRRTLSKFARLDEAPNFHHQLRAKPQALSFFRSEAKVSEHIPGRLLNLHRHVCFLSRRRWNNSLNRDLANAKSYLAIFLVFFSKA
jgi:hypothetical protein